MFFRYEDILTEQTRIKMESSPRKNGTRFLMLQVFQHPGILVLYKQSEINMKTFISCRKEVEDFFASRDRDFDGQLSFEEFLGEESKIEKLFKKMDRNKDGKISKEVSLGEGSEQKMSQIVEKVQKGGVSAKIKILLD